MPQTRSASGRQTVSAPNAEKIGPEAGQKSIAKVDNDESPQKVQSTLDEKLVDKSEAEDQCSKRDEAKSNQKAEVEEKESNDGRLS